MRGPGRWRKGAVAVEVEARLDGKRNSGVQAEAREDVHAARSPQRPPWRVESAHRGSEPASRTAASPGTAACRGTCFNIERLRRTERQQTERQGQAEGERQRRCGVGPESAAAASRPAAEDSSHGRLQPQRGRRQEGDQAARRLRRRDWRHTPSRSRAGRGQCRSGEPPMKEERQRSTSGSTGRRIDDLASIPGNSCMS